MTFQENLNFSKICWSRVALKSGNGGAKETLLNTLLLPHSWFKSQKSAQNQILKIHEMDGPYLCLQQFDNQKLRNRNRCKFADICSKKLVKSHQVNLFFGGFQLFGTTMRSSSDLSRDLWRPPTSHHFWFYSERGHTLLHDSYLRPKR